MQSYIFVKSLVRLDAYKKVGIVHGSKQREGWSLKKWEEWQREIYDVEDAWKQVFELEQDSLEILQALVMGANEVIRPRITMKINQLMQHLPEQHPRSLRRLNMVELKRDNCKLRARMNNAKDMVKALKQAHVDICRVHASDPRKP
nr:unnamed protein product [Digitaria exilis]